MFELKSKICTKCKRSLPLVQFSKQTNKKSGYCSQCKSCVSIYQKRWDSNNKEKRRKYVHQWYIRNRYRLLTDRKAIRKHSKYDKKRRAKIKSDVIYHYSNGTMKCKCGYSDIGALCLDHIKNDGAKDRRQRVAANRLYLWLIKNDYPKGYQVLCFNCNQIKHIKFINE